MRSIYVVKIHRRCNLRPIWKSFFFVFQIASFTCWPLLTSSTISLKSNDLCSLLGKLPLLPLLISLRDPLWLEVGESIFRIQARKIHIRSNGNTSCIIQRYIALLLHLQSRALLQPKRAFYHKLSWTEFHRKDLNRSGLRLQIELE